MYKLIKQLNLDSRQDSRLYEFDKPVPYDVFNDITGIMYTRYTKYVMVSSIRYVGDSDYIVSNRPETMVFPANEDGGVIDWGEIACIMKYGAHEEALESIDYES